jgi:sugar phosphate isomerase/epimerase
MVKAAKSRFQPLNHFSWIAMQEVFSKVQVHMPFHRLRDGLLERVLSERINLEISFTQPVLDSGARDDFRRVADVLREAELTITFHAPFMDLRPGALDPKIRQATGERLRQVFDLVPFFHPRSIVCHPSFDERYYVSADQQWLENSIATWTPFLALAEELDTRIAFENVYETAPRQLKMLLDAFPSPRACLCFDAGHFNVFARATLPDWLETLGSRIGQLHLHDNNGVTDEHLPVGEGNFPFAELFQFIRTRNINPIMTLEAHSEENLGRTVKNIRTMGLLERDADLQDTGTGTKRRGP